ncbi:MAG: hypothetical protein K2O00_09495, partial [Muribaculaceae bacterium]|nr:hypothetical protein [Muribaculaceae bacterium]
TKRIGNFFKLPIHLFHIFLIPNSRYYLITRNSNFAPPSRLRQAKVHKKSCVAMLRHSFLCYWFKDP